MNIKEVKELIQEVLQSDISEFELEHTGTKVKLKRGFGGEATAASPMPPQTAAVSFAPALPVALEATSTTTGDAGASEDSKLHIITSPIVGTVYCAPSPGAEPYVKLGDLVEEGSILCLVEAMKLMNEIPSDVGGEVVRVYIENGNPVEFGQKLFGIHPRRQG
jgi:acetyl-CoA carboxylase biotin carboxyl carrier protein